MAYRSKTKKARGVNCLLAFAIFLAGVSTAPAQLPTATILGTVKDSSGAVVPEATITARNVETGLARTTVTAVDGSYRMPALPVGNYEVRVEHPGFQTEVRGGLTLTVAQEAVVNVALQVGAMEQTVAVTAEAPLVNTTSGSLGALVDEQKIAELPLNGRNYVDLMMLQPGISQHANKNNTGGQIGTWFSSNGAPVRSNNMLLDGAIITNMWGTGAASATGTTLGIDGIQEWRVVTNSFSAEYGMTMGSQMVIASKGGTNAFHGSAFEYLRNNVLDAANTFYVPVAANNFARIPPYKRNNFGGSLGGPITKDKTFFYGVYEGLRERQGITTIDSVMAADCHPAAATAANNWGAGTVVWNGQGARPANSIGPCPQLGNNPAGAGTNSVTIAAVTAPLFALLPSPNLPVVNNQYQFTYPFTQPATENYGQLRADHSFSAADTVFARYTVDDALQTQTSGYPQFSTVLSSRAQFVTLSESHVFSPTLLNTARFSFSRTNIPQDDPPTPFLGPQYSLMAGQEFGRLAVSGVSGFGYVQTAPQFVKQNIFTWSDDVFLTRGRHALKLGTLINHYQNQALRQTTARGTISFPSIANFLRGIPSSVSTGLLPPPVSVLGRTYHFNTLGFYAQDDVRVRSNWTLNVGLRYEFATSYEEQYGHGAAFRNIVTDATGTLGPPFQNPSLHNFSPRFGFAWDVRGDGKTSVRGGYGLLYDIASLGFSLFQTNLVPPFGASASVANSSNSVLVLPLDNLLLASTTPRTLNGIQWDLQQPQMMQYNLAIERQLPAAVVLTVAYGGSRGRHLMQTTEGNPTVPQGAVQNGTCVARSAGQAPTGGFRDCWLGLFNAATNPGGIPASSTNPAGGDPRLNTKWGNYQMTGSGGDSWYNSLQVLHSRRLSKGLQLQGSFTWAKTLDDMQGQAGGETQSTPIYPSYPQVIRLERGPATFDVTKNFRLNAIYRFPNFHAQRGILGNLLSGWEAAGILAAQSGYPFTPVLSNNRSRTGSSVSAGGGGTIDKPNLAPGRTLYSATHGTTPADCVLSTGAKIPAGTPLGMPDQWFDPCAFSLPPVGTLGNVGRGSLRGPAFNNLDLSLIKDTPLKFREGAMLEFRAEFFNLLNHPSFITPRTGGGGQAGGAGVVFSGSVNSVTENPLATAGVLTDTASKARQIQLAVKILF